MKALRIHCWIDVAVDDEDLARMIVEVQLSTMVGKNNIVRAGMPGKPKEIKIGK